MIFKYMYLRKINRNQRLLVQERERDKERYTHSYKKKI